MKKLLTYTFALLAAFAIVFTSCQTEDVAPLEEAGAIIEFALHDAPADDQSNARQKDGHHPWELLPECTPDAIAKVAITINGTPYELVPQFFAGLGKWQVEIPINQPGVYTVNALALLNGADEVIYLTPDVASDFAPFVNKAVPFEFEIQNGEKIVNTADAICFHPSRLPEFGVKIYEFGRCIIFKNFWFANLCDDYYGHQEADIQGGLYFPSLGKYVPGGFAHGFFYTYSRVCIENPLEIVWIVLRLESPAGEVKYVIQPVPAWLLFFAKNYVVHLNADCEPNLCKQAWVAEAAVELEVEGFNADDYSPEDIDEARYLELTGGND